MEGEHPVLKHILHCLHHADRPLPITEIAKRTQLYITEADRLVQRLVKANHVRRVNGCFAIEAMSSRQRSAAAFELSVNKVKELLQRRPSASLRFDQCLATEETVIRRVEFMQERRDILDKSILLLGDDDFLSLALALTGLPASITVLDADPRVLKSISRIARENSVSVTAEQYDVREELRSEYRGAYDVVFTDPPYTREGAKLFLWRAAQAVVPKTDGVIYLCLSEMDLALESYSSIQSFALNIGLSIMEVTPSFNVYENRRDMAQDCRHMGINPSNPWFVSTLWRLRSSGKSNRPVSGGKNRPITFSEIYKYDAETI